MSDHENFDEEEDKSFEEAEAGEAAAEGSDDDEGNDVGKRKTRDEDDDEDDDDGDDDDDDEDDEEEEEEVAGSSSKRKRVQSQKPAKKKKSKKPYGSRFFEVEAGVDDEDEEEEYYSSDDEVGRREREAVVTEAELEARRRVAKRQEQSRKFFDIGAEEAAARFEQKRKVEKAYEKLGYESGEGMVQQSAVMQQSRLPDVSDPPIFMLKVKTGMEQHLVMAMMRKVLDYKQRDQDLHIKSVFCTGTQGYIYVEAIAEPQAKIAVQGINGIYQRSLKKVPVSDVPSLLTVQVRKKPVQAGQWARMRRGPLKDDLVRVLEVLEGGARVLIQAVPRPDYKATLEERGAKKGTARARPPQRLFDEMEAREANRESVIPRKPMPGRGGERFTFWNNEYFSDGYMIKEVNPDTYLQTDGFRPPRIEETRLFRDSKFGRSQDKDEDEEDEDAEKPATSQVQDIIKQLALPTDPEPSARKISPYVVGDLVQVTSGEMTGLVGRVKAINEAQQTVKVFDISMKIDVDVEIALLTKYVESGTHVKIVNGPYMGRTGNVLRKSMLEGRAMAAILTDGDHMEVTCDVQDIQASLEILMQIDTLKGYELYDLVQLSENEAAVVVAVGADKLRVVNHSDTLKEIAPEEIHGPKLNMQSEKRATAFDGNQATVKVGDVVNVKSGPHMNKTGTIRHINKGILWLHSNAYLKNSGIFAIRGRVCVVAGANRLTATSSSTSMGPPTGGGMMNRGTKVADSNKPHMKMAKDPLVGKTIKIIKGSHKGMLAQVIDVSNKGMLHVELLAQMKKISVERERTKEVGDSKGSFESDKRDLVSGGYIGSDSIPDTPFLTAETPRHYVGGETPVHPTGSETPMHGYGDQTPGRDDDDDVWNVSERDREPVGGVGGGLARDAAAGGRAGSYAGNAFTTDNSGGSRYENSSLGSGSHHGMGIGSSYGSGYGGNYGGGGDASMRSLGDSSNWATPDFGSNSASPFSDSQQGSFRGGSSASGQYSSSPFSPGSGSSSGNPYSPSSAMESPMGPSRAGGGSGSVFNYSDRDWVQGMVVVFTTGARMGQQGVVASATNQSGWLKAQIRGSRGGEGSIFEVHSSEMKPAQARKGDRVVSLSGGLKGSTGIVKSVAGSDLVMDSGKFWKYTNVAVVV